jgi:proteasome lid subunit RPN8/RPN11
MALRLTRTQIVAINEHGERDYPGECCGALIGRLDGDDKLIEAVHPFENIHEDGAARRFRIDPLEMYKVERAARESGQNILGFYHSHPDHPADPSEYDREHAWPIYSYVIVSVVTGKARNMKSWVLTEDRAGYNAEPIVLSPE